MSIIATEIDSIHGAVGKQRMIFYKCQDSQGLWHPYGPVITIDDAFSVEAHKVIVAAKVAERLAVCEFEQVIA
jgi:hypothetical protein